MVAGSKWHTDGKSPFQFKVVLMKVLREVPIGVGSPEGGSHKGGSSRAFPTKWRTQEYGNLHVSIKKRKKKKKSLLFLSSIL